MLGAQRKDCPLKNSEGSREGRNGTKRISIEEEGQGQQQEERGMKDDTTTALLPMTPMALIAHVEGADARR
jgi:hypothetical protein